MSLRAFLRPLVRNVGLKSATPTCLSRLGQHPQYLNSSTQGLRYFSTPLEQTRNKRGGNVLEPIVGEAYFKDQVCIVTGGSTGMGGAMVDYFAQRGARVYNLDVTPRQDTGSLASQVTTIHCDVGNTKQLKENMQSILEETNNKVDYLLAHAGIHRFTSVHDTTEEVYDTVVDINIRGVFFALQAVLPAMIAQKSGSIVITGSDQVFIGKAASSVYGNILRV